MLADTDIAAVAARVCGLAARVCGLAARVCGLAAAAAARLLSAAADFAADAYALWAAAAVWLSAAAVVHCAVGGRRPVAFTDAGGHVCQATFAAAGARAGRAVAWLYRREARPDFGDFADLARRFPDVGTADGDVWFAVWARRAGGDGGGGAVTSERMFTVLVEPTRRLLTVDGAGRPTRLGRVTLADVCRDMCAK